MATKGRAWSAQASYLGGFLWPGYHGDSGNGEVLVVIHVLLQKVLFREGEQAR